MAKPQRKTINDALAEIAALGPHMARDHAPHDHVAPSNDVGRDNAPRDVIAPAPARIDVGRGHAPHDHVEDDGYRVRVRREKPHVSLYAHPRVFKAIRDLAIAQRKKPHDLYIEGLRLMMAQYGLDFDSLDGRSRGA